MRHVISYDISDDGRRYRAADVLLRYGVRIQRSVYECELDDQELEEVLADLEGVINLGWDVVHAFRLCEGCVRGARVLGAAPIGMGDRYYVV